MTWSVGYHEAAAGELAEQPNDIRAKLDHVVELIETFGLERLPAKYTKHLEDRIWEFRLKGTNGIARALYVTVHGKRIIVVRVFTKKTEKTPRREIELALRRAKEAA